MRLGEATIRAAFREHGSVYANTRGWDIPHRLKCWSLARSAFEAGCYEDFERLYRHLKNEWQVFRRPGGPPWSSDQTFEHLAGLDQRYRSLTLSQMSDADLDGCWQIIKSMSRIKPTKSPSVVAISKFLHFWNPRLFVIVDDAVMWKRVLSRSWLRQPIAEERGRVERLLPDPSCPKNDLSCELISYLAVLAWSAVTQRRNPDVTPLFAEYVRAGELDRRIDFPIDTYEAAAVEWLLLGLAELPPLGVELD
ncbi:MAG: hypothetical protein KJZ54_14085 [Phycisphaerales bacterium]|nr:hypothetical protein [Phycisphaerales bacterium]